jgi:hypothetical protein
MRRGVSFISMRLGDWPDVVTPRHIAKRLGVSDKALRGWLRENPPNPHATYDRWEFTPDEADEIVRAFSRASGLG